MLNDELKLILDLFYLRKLKDFCVSFELKIMMFELLDIKLPFS
jgi:hypothetical protein